MPRRILIVQGHPDPRPERFGRALARAYGEGAQAAGHELRMVDIATLDFPILRSGDDFENGEIPASLRPAQEALAWADHLVIFYPLWLGTMPALLKAFLEQVFRPGFAVARATDRMPGGLLQGKSARIVVTMGMPAFVYRWFYRAHGLKGLERNVLSFSGIGPIRESLIGTVAAADGGRRARWLEKMRALGRAGV